MRKELIAEGMSCNHCKMTIENAVKALTGIQYVNADVESKTVTVEFDEKVQEVSAIKNAIEDSGYKTEDA